jgi:flagellar protein FlaJ
MTIFKRVGRRITIAVTAASLAASAIIVLYAVFYLMVDPTLSHLVDDAAIAAFSVAVFPPSFIQIINQMWRRKVDEAVPELLRDVLQSQSTGLSIVRAVEEASARDYGPLSIELRKAVARMKWGVSFDESLEMMADDIGTPLVRRALTLILEASRAGGDIRRVLELSSRYVRDVHTLERERAAMVRPYILVSYVAYFIFLFTAIALQNLFFIPLAELTRTAGAAFLGMTAAAINVQETAAYFFNMALIQAFCTGLVAGKMGEGSSIAGLKHSLLLMIIGYMVMTVLLAGRV